MGSHKCEGDRVNSHKPLIICSRSSKGFGGACGWGFGFSSFAPAPPSSSSSPSSMRSGSACPRLYNRRHEGHMRLVRRLLLYQSICKGGSKLLAHHTASLLRPLATNPLQTKHPTHQRHLLRQHHPAHFQHLPLRELGAQRVLEGRRVREEGRVDEGARVADARAVAGVVDEGLGGEGGRFMLRRIGGWLL